VPRSCHSVSGGRPTSRRNTNSGDHHPRGRLTAIYLAGRPIPCSVFADLGHQVLLATEPGDYVFGPPGRPPPRGAPDR